MELLPLPVNPFTLSLSQVKNCKNSINHSTQQHSERPKLYAILAFLSATGLSKIKAAFNIQRDLKLTKTFRVKFHKAVMVLKIILQKKKIFSLSCQTHGERKVFINTATGI